MSNKAAWIKALKAKPLEVNDAPYYQPGPGQLLMKNGAVAINPVDWKIQVRSIAQLHFSMLT
jgi:NADPH:quinone reductase-like Zn-dependent oxidoreductase